MLTIRLLTLLCIAIILSCALTIISRCCRSEKIIIDDDELEKIYTRRRQEIMDEERTRYFGGKIVLDEIEERANAVIMKYKSEELGSAYVDSSGKFPRSLNILGHRRITKKSRLYRAIRRLPKAGALHVHLSSMTSRRFILTNVTRRSNLYVCHLGVKIMKLSFNDETIRAGNASDYCKWSRLSDLRSLNSSIDDKIAEALSMFDDGVDDYNRDVNIVWKRFERIFDFVQPLVTYRPVYEDYLYDLLTELYEDNVQFVEIRASFHSLYESNGKTYKQSEIIDIYNGVVDRFISQHPDFIAVKWIYSRRRDVDLTTLRAYIRDYRSLRRSHSNTIVGFDLIGQEDKGKPLKDFASELRKLSLHDVGTRFFFHAGETNRLGMDADENLVDAVLLNAKRIGHGYALTKHPRLLELVTSKKIAIEILPISNHVLGLVNDLRNHPAANLFAQNFPLIVSSDDPGFWNARGLSDDFYVTFVDIMSARADLRSLKQLIVNSIVYSSLNATEKVKAEIVWMRRWREFVIEIGSTYV